ncbi:MAG: hypothetical protein KF819_29185 [Labilithrix sp.]|nr:hypothetical protein [Labilithrix sp.]
MKRQAILVAALTLGAFATVTSDAKADPVGNPGEFEFIVPWGQDSLFRFASNHAIELGGNGSGASAYFAAELEGDGEASSITSSFYSSSFVIASLTVAATLQFRPASTGSVDVSGPALGFSIRARIRFDITGGGSGNCNTAEFDLPLRESTESGVCPTSGYDETTGWYCLENSFSFTVPQLAASACSNNGNAINNHFDLGITGGSFNIWNGEVSPIITQ